MGTFNVVLITSVIGLLFRLGLGFTVRKFRNIESGETDRRKHIEEDVIIEERQTQN